jgi:hypothetical protein
MTRIHGFTRMYFNRLDSYYMKSEEFTNGIIEAFYKVYNTLGYGFLEKVYRNAVVLELTEAGLEVDMEKRVLVFYKKQVVGGLLCRHNSWRCGHL